MNHPLVYELSKRHGPPRIDLRKAEIMDSYGFEGRATLAINHRICIPSPLSLDEPSLSTALIPSCIPWTD